MPTFAHRMLAPFAPLAVVAMVGVAGLQAGCSGHSHSATQETSGEVSSTPTVGSPGSHVATHGMVLFGKERVYLSHIPLFNQPHNLQVVVEVKVSGVPETQNFADKLYTMAPTPFSLFDLANGTLPAIVGTVFDGNFEAGGRPIFRNVRFEVQRVIFQQGLLPTAQRSPTLDYIAVGTPSDPYLVHVIDERASFDSIVGVRFGELGLSESALEAGTFVTIAGGVNNVRTRLGRGNVAELVLAPTVEKVVREQGLEETEQGELGEEQGEAKAEEPTGEQGPSTKEPTEPKEPAANVSLQVRGEYSCLAGPDFFRACAPITPPATP